MTDLHLHFEGPFTFTAGGSSVFHSEFADSPGIYLVTIRQRLDDTHLIHYVGQTKWLGKRHREHLLHILGLDYDILDPDKAQDGVSEVIWPGAWRDKTPDSASRQIEAYRTIHDQMLPYLCVLNIFFAELDIDDRTRKHVEGCIGRNLRNNHPEAKVLYPDDNRIGGEAEKDSGTLRISSTERIRGLDSEIPY